MSLGKKKLAVMSMLPIRGKMKTVPIKAEKPCRREMGLALWNSAFPEMTSPIRSPADWAPAGQCCADLPAHSSWSQIQVLLSRELRFIRVKGHLPGHLITGSSLWDGPQNLPKGGTRAWD